MSKPRTVPMLVVAIGLTMALAPAAAGHGPPSQETSDVYSIPAVEGGDLELIEGATARLQRTPDTLSTRTDTRDLPAHQVQTLWWGIFNNPEQCATSPCGVADLFAAEVEPACLYADGSVVGGNGQARFHDRLSIDEQRPSCLPFFGGEDHGLQDPMGAEVHLFVHSHGPLRPGEVPAQRSSFDGGCEEFLADGVVPEAPGECATIQVAVFLP